MASLLWFEVRFPLLFAPRTAERIKESIPATIEQLKREDRRNQIGSWIGDSWVPPEPWKLYSTEQLKTVYKKKKILFIGDSLARRASMTLYGILNSPNSSTPKSVIDDNLLINYNSASITDPCTKWNHTVLAATATPHRLRICREGEDHEILHLWAQCYYKVQSFVKDEIARDSNLTMYMDVMVVSLGVWEFHKPFRCRAKGQGSISDHTPLNEQLFQDLRNETMQVLRATISDLFELQRIRPNLQIVWRTVGFAADELPFSYKKTMAKAMNQVAMDMIDHSYDTITNHTKRMVYFHWGGAMESRSFGESRIAGDSEYHYGLEARLVLIQMLTNVLQEEKQHGIPYAI